MINILFLDDEENILNTYRRMLRSYDVNGFYATNSKEASKIISNNQINLIISDYRLEQETGLDFLKQVRLNNITVPMVIISGYADESFIKNALEMDVIQGYFLKPISMDVFGQVLMKFLHGDNV